MTNFISGIIAMLIAAPLSGGNLTTPKLTLKSETVWMIIFVAIFTLFNLYKIIEILLEGLGGAFIFVGILIGLNIGLWICVIFQIRKYKRSKGNKNG